MKVPSLHIDWLEGRMYHIVRVGLFVLACVLIVVALFVMSFNTGQLSRTQQVAAELIQSEQRAEVLLIASYDDSDAATVKQRDGIIDLLNRSSVGVDVEYLDVCGCSTTRNVPGLQMVSAGETPILVEATNDASASESAGTNGTTSTSDAASSVVQTDWILGENSLASYGAILAESPWGQAITSKVRAHGPYSAVICLDDDALCYVEAVHDSLFPNTPVVFAGVSDVSHAMNAYEAGYATGLVEGLDAAGIIDTARTMRTDADRVLVITDNSLAGLGNRTQLHAALATTDGTAMAATTEANGISTAASASTSTTTSDGELMIELLNASTISRATLADRIAAAGDDTIILYLGANTDSSGNAYTASETSYFLSHAATQPVFAMGFEGVGEGYAGANFIDYEKEGQRTGEIVVSVLNGTRPADIEVENFVSSGSVFDGSTLADYSISTSTLPSTAFLLNQDDFWSSSLRPIVMPIVLLIFGLACLVLFALLGYRRTASDLAEIVSQRNFLEQRFYTDNLTEMPNMQWLTAYAGTAASSEVKSIVEVAFDDLDQIDATRGKGTAEEVVKTLADRLNGLDKLFLVRTGQTGFILGFEVEIKPGSDSLDNMKYLITQPVSVGGDTVTVEPRFGVYNRETGMSIEEMVAGADIAVQHAKEIEPNDDTIFYDADMRRAVDHKLEITALLKEAIEEEDFVVVYQPQIDLMTGDVVGYEALVRLRSRKYPPEQFIPIAEMNGQIVDIDRIVTKKVVQQLATWKKRKQRMRPVSINHSASQLRDDTYLDYLVEVLDEYGVAHGLIRLDLRESLFLNQMERATKFVDDLKERGFSFAIDGFGAGYTSISRVMQIPADIVKIDRGIVATFLTDGETDFMGNLVRLVHGADKLVVIEGVETADQLAMCREIGCDIVQGFFFAEPMLPERAVQYKPEFDVLAEPKAPAEPKKEAKREVEPEPKPEPEPEPELEAEPEPEPELEPESESDAEAEAEVEAQSDSEPEPEDAIELELETDTLPEMIENEVVVVDVTEASDEQGAAAPPAAKSRAARSNVARKVAARSKR